MEDENRAPEERNVWEEPALTEEEPAGKKKRKEKRQSQGGSTAFGFTLGAVAMTIVCVFVLIATRGMTAGAAPSASNAAGIPAKNDSILSEEAQEKLKKIRYYIDSMYLFDNVEDADFDTGLIKGYINSLGDPYTVYYTPEEYQELMESTTGIYSGIGVVVQQDMNTGIITMIKPYTDGPGYEAGIRAGDILYKVGGEEVTGEDLNLVVARIKGEAGTTVDIEVYRSSEDRYIDLTVTRRTIEIHTIEHEMLDHQIGYIQMDSFDDVTYNQYMEAFRDLKDQGMKALIVDLRDNGGGLLSSVVSILDQMLPQGTITYTIDKYDKKQTYTSDKVCVLDVPAVVLTNGYTASASEIFTGAMQDYDKAEIVGTQTFGKGIVQMIVDLEDGSAIKVTTSRYYTPNGICIHGEGITPDVVIENDVTTEADEQLEEAIRILLEKIQ